jgi:Ca-activated chloride channel family protein
MTPKAVPPSNLNEWLAGAKSGLLLLRTAADSTLQPGPALDTEVTLQISGLLARAKVRQRFQNPGAEWAEGVYVFPLPDDAAVDHMRIDTGSRIIEGQIREKAEARKTYERAKSEGRRASLVEQERPNIFTTLVANIPPDGEITVEIEYQQSVHQDQNEFSLRFPMVVGPRFIPGQPLSEGSNAGMGWAPDTDRVPDGSRITPPVSRPEAGPINPVQLSIDLAPGFAVDRLESPYHDITIDERNGRYRVTLDDGPVPADRDFVLQWTPLPGDEPQATLFVETHGDRDYAFVMVSPPHRPGSAPGPPPREVVYVIDTSGSMAGDSITQAKIALGMALGRLRTGDRFNVIQFNSTTEALFPRAVDIDLGNVERALTYVNNLAANGGTHIRPALERALADSGRAGLLRQVVFLTDGSVGNENELFEVIQKNLGASRLFPIGIGSAPNTHFMRKAAKHGRGSFTHIGNPEEVGEKMSALFRKLEAVVLTDIEIELPSGDIVEAYPDGILDLYEGEPAVFTFALDDALDRVSVRGRRHGVVWSVDLERGEAEARRGVHVLWARRKIAALMDARLGVRDEERLHDLRNAVVDTALDHHLVSRYTSLVAVDITPERRSYEKLDTHAMAANLPQGWKFGSVFGLARTATPAALQLGFGAMLIFAGLFVRRALELQRW